MEFENEPTNGMAIAGFVLSLSTLFFGWIPFLGWITWLLGLVFSIIGLVNAKNQKGKGKGVASASCTCHDFYILSLKIVRNEII